MEVTESMELHAVSTRQPDSRNYYVIGEDDHLYQVGVYDDGSIHRDCDASMEIVNFARLLDRFFFR
jgi:hypothetical protein